jgi:hypothetical protein
VQEPRALVRRCPAPRAVERSPRRLDRAVDVGLAGHRRPAEHLARCRLDDVPQLARRGLDGLAVDEEAVLAAGRDRHRCGSYASGPDPKPGNDV